MSVDIDHELSEIQLLKEQIQLRTESQREQMEVLDKQMREIMDPYVLKIQEHDDRIREAVLANQESFKGDHGKVTFRKSYPRYSWDNKALEGYAAAGHDELYQFRKETVINANVQIKAGE